MDTVLEPTPLPHPLRPTDSGLAEMSVHVTVFIGIGNSVREALILPMPEALERVSRAVSENDRVEACRAQVSEEIH